MAVMKVKAKKQINYALPMIERMLVLPYVMTILGKENFTGAKNDTANFKVTEGSIATARDYDFRGRTGPIVMDDIYQFGGNIPVRLNKHVVSATPLELEHLTLDDITFASDVLAPQVEAVAKSIEAKALAGFRALHPKHEIAQDADTDPLLISAEARRLMDSDKVAPQAGRVFLVGTDVAAAWLTSDRLSKYDSTGETGTPALRDAIIGRLAGSPVVVHNGLDPQEGYYMHSSGLVLANAAPVVPAGAVTGNSGISRRGIAMTWIQDYDSPYARDRSMVHSFCGVNEIRDERAANGDWIVEEGEFDDEELAVMKNSDGTDVTPVAVGTRKNVRILKLNLTFANGGSVLPTSGS